MRDLSFIRSLQGFLLMEKIVRVIISKEPSEGSCMNRRPLMGLILAEYFGSIFYQEKTLKRGFYQCMTSERYNNIGSLNVRLTKEGLIRVFLQ